MVEMKCRGNSPFRYLKNIHSIMAFILAIFSQQGFTSTVQSNFFWISGYELLLPSRFGTEQTLGFRLERPIYKSDHFLLKDNLVTGTIEAAVSPISLTGKVTALVTPVAFLTIGGSFLAGNGWFAMNGHGTAIYDSTGKHDRTGLIYKGALWTQLQIETKGIFKNDYLNFQAVAVERVTNNSFAAANDYQSWIFQNDDGENFNGWIWNQFFFAGYAYPILSTRILTAGVLLGNQCNVSRYSMSTMDANGWGSDFLNFEFNPLIKFKYNRDLEFVILCKIRQLRDYDNDDTTIHFMSKHYEGSQFHFYKVQAMMTLLFGRKTWE